MNYRQTNFSASHNPQQGMSLVELMIAITLGIFLIWGVTQSFLASKQVYRLQQGMARIQENGRLAQEFLGYDIRNSGDYGCASGDDFMLGTGTPTPVDQPDTRNDTVCTTTVAAKGLNLIDASSTNYLDDEFEYAVYGFDNVTGSVTYGTAYTLPTVATPNGGTATAILSTPPKPGSDVLMVHPSDDAGVVTSENGATPVTTPTVFSSFGLNTSTAQFINANGEKDRLAVSDCATMRIFGVQNMSSAGSTVTITGDYSCAASFALNATARKVTTVYYFVGINARGGYSLYKQVGGFSGATAQELLEGVEDLQLQYGIDYAANAANTKNDDVVNWYEDAGSTSDGNVADWVAAWNGWDWDATNNQKDNSLVRSVRYSLLMRTEEDGVVKDQQTLLYNGATLCGGAASCVNGDHRLREVFTGTIGIRSRDK